MAKFNVLSSKVTCAFFFVNALWLWDIGDRTQGPALPQASLLPPHLNELFLCVG